MNSKEQYAIGINHDGGIWFYVGNLDHEKQELPPVNRYSSTILDAKIFDNYDDAMKVARKDIPVDYIKWVMKVYDCPLCGRKYAGYPAISRKDNETEICPDCGTKEALEIAMKNGLVKQTK